MITNIVFILILENINFTFQDNDNKRLLHSVSGHHSSSGHYSSSGHHSSSANDSSDHSLAKSEN